MRHVTDRQLCAFLDDVLVGPPDDETARHLGSCTLCHGRYEAWTRGDDALRSLLSQAADEDALERWSSWVETAVIAERNGEHVPEIGLLRLPLPSTRSTPLVALAHVASTSPRQVPRYATRRPAGPGAPARAARRVYARRPAEPPGWLERLAQALRPAHPWLPLAILTGVLGGVLLVLLLMRI